MSGLPTGNQTVENGKDHGAISAGIDFNRIVAESKSKLAQADLEVKKRGRGAPKKPRDANGNIIRASSGPGPESASLHQSQSVANPTPAPDISPYLIRPIIALSSIPASRAGIPELIFSPDEAGAVAFSLNQLLNVFIPDIGLMSPKTAAIISAGATIGTIIFSKYQIYLIKIALPKTEAAPEIKESPAPNPGTAPFPVENAGGSVLAGDFFKK